MSSQLTPEQEAREVIDAALARAGWIVQSKSQLNLFAGAGVAVREMQMKKGHGYADYILFVHGKAVGALEAKRPGVPLTGVEPQARKYSNGLPAKLNAPIRPLPFLYTSTGVETRFVNLLDPHPRSRRVFAPHRPETLAEWLAAEPLPIRASKWAATGAAETSAPRPATLRSRLRAMPSPDDIPGLWPNQLEAVANLEKLLAQGRDRALIQMATGSGKSLTAVASIYRLIKFGGARRVLFLVDRNHLGTQAELEFKGYRCYDDNHEFTRQYTVQHLSSGTIRSASKVVITTIQRLYGMLRGEPDAGIHADADGESDPHAQPLGPPEDVAYNPAIPPEYFDVIFIDECHRSIYTVWRQVIEYFDAFLIGLTATPAMHTFGFFGRNLVMEYNHERAVADGVNVDFDIYRIRTRITEQGATIEAAPGVTVGLRERGTRALRWQQPDEDIAYTAKQLDREVVARDQIRLIVRTFKERLFRDIFPGRTHVPKTLIFAKDDSHAEDIVDIVREEFGQGDDFCKKITYRVSGADPKDLIQDLRTAYNPRIAVTVDMIATGTDVRCIEIVMFLRAVKSRTMYEQMKGRGVRVISRDELLSVTPDADAKTRFVLIDCVGVTETDMQDSRPLERKPGVSFKKLLEHVAYGGTDADTIASLASRLSRLDRQCSPEERRRIQEQGGVSLNGLVRGLIEALDPDAQDAEARRAHHLGEGQAPSPAQLQQAAATLIQAAVAPLATQPDLRDLLENLKKQHEQIIDEVSMDQLIAAGPSVAARDRARALVQSFEDFLEENKDEIAALQVFYARPYGQRLRYGDIKALAEAIQAPPRQWTPARLWQAYEQLDQSRVRGASGQRLLTDMVSLVRFALHQSDELVPYAQHIQERFDNWMAQQANTGRRFTDEQVTWLHMMRDHVAQSLEIDMEDFDYTPFVEHGGLGRPAPGGRNDRPRRRGARTQARAAESVGRRKQSDEESPAAEERPLPPGWAWATIGDIASVQGGIQKGKSRKPDDILREVPYLRVANVQRGYLDLSEVKTIRATDQEIELLRLQPGDILFNEGGDRDKLGRGWVWSGEIADCIHQNHVFRARLQTGEILPRFVSWYANSEGQRYFYDEGKQTTNLASINLTKLRGFPIPVPPPQEQTRISEVIETQFSELDAAVEGLKRVQANLKRYRASVLQAAVEGRLVPTEAALARQEGRDYEPAPVLLQRILDERRHRWERAELARMKAKGKPPRDDSWKARYKEPAAPDTSNLPPLPEGWCWATVDQLAEVQGGIQKGKKRKPDEDLREVPYLRVANVQRGYLDLSEVKTIAATEDEIELLRLQVGDVLFNEGGDRDKLGRGWVWNGEMSDCIHQNHVFRARLLTEDVIPQFLSWYGNSSGQQYFFEQGKQTTNLASLNLTKLRGLPVPIPPISEQKRIAAEVEEKLSDIDAVQVSTEANIIRCHRLRQSILKWAFEGKLVDQDPNDEPASALLERIRTERVANSTTNREAAALGGVGSPPRPQAEGRGRTGGTPPRQPTPASPRGQRKPRKQGSTAP